MQKMFYFSDAKNQTLLSTSYLFSNFSPKV